MSTPGKEGFFIAVYVGIKDTDGVHAPTCRYSTRSQERLRVACIGMLSDSLYSREHG